MLEVLFWIAVTVLLLSSPFVVFLFAKLIAFGYRLGDYEALQYIVRKEHEKNNPQN